MQLKTIYLLYNIRMFKYFPIWWLISRLFKLYESAAIYLVYKLSRKSYETMNDLATMLYLLELAPKEYPYRTKMMSVSMVYEPSMLVMCTIAVLIMPVLLVYWVRGDLQE